MSTALQEAPVVATASRAIAYRTRGSMHGPITRLVSPGDVGEWIKPFVFLDLFASDSPEAFRGFGMHPHSGIATLTYLIAGDLSYEDTTGKSGELHAGSVEWMRAGNGVWHTGAPVGDAPSLGFQLWVVLPPALENAPALSQYLAAPEVPQAGPARVLLGSHEGVTSPIEAPSPMAYLAVQLRDGEHWRYVPPAGHTVAWVAVATGALDAAGHAVGAEELVVFEESDGAIDFTARGDAHFVLGSAVKHPHDLVMGRYSVHTSREALDQGEAEIRRIGAQLRQERRLG